MLSFAGSPVDAIRLPAAGACVNPFAALQRRRAATGRVQIAVCAGTMPAWSCFTDGGARRPGSRWRFWLRSCRFARVEACGGTIVLTTLVHWLRRPAFRLQRSRLRRPRWPTMTMRPITGITQRRRPAMRRPRRPSRIVSTATARQAAPVRRMTAAAMALRWPHRYFIFPPRSPVKRGALRLCPRSSRGPSAGCCPSPRDRRPPDAVAI